jgi:hypothetical protein
VGKILGRVLGKGGTGYTKRTEQYLSDYARVMQIAGGVMAEYGMDQVKMGRLMGVPVQCPKADQHEEVPRYVGF